MGNNRRYDPEQVTEPGRDSFLTKSKTTNSIKTVKARVGPELATDSDKVERSGRHIIPRYSVLGRYKKISDEVSPTIASSDNDTEVAIR